MTPSIRLVRYTALACLAAVVAIGATLAIAPSASGASARRAAAAPGSSYADPEVITEAMPPAGGILDSSPANHLDLESLPGSGPRTLQWEAHSSARRASSWPAASSSFADAYSAAPRITSPPSAAFRDELEASASPTRLAKIVV